MLYVQAIYAGNIQYFKGTCVFFCMIKYVGTAVYCMATWCAL